MRLLVNGINIQCEPPPLRHSGPFPRRAAVMSRAGSLSLDNLDRVGSLRAAGAAFGPVRKCSAASWANLLTRDWRLSAGTRKQGHVPDIGAQQARRPFADPHDGNIRA
jgi:hypothetical protein